MSIDRGETRFVRYDDWLALVGGTVQIRCRGSVIQTGVVDQVMHDSSALWLHSRGVQPRRAFLKEDGYEAWISPRDLQPRMAESVAARSRQLK